MTTLRKCIECLKNDDKHAQKYIYIPKNTIEKKKENLLFKLFQFLDCCLLSDST